MHQPGILAPVPKASRYLTFQLRPGGDPRPTLERLAEQVDGESTVVGLGAALVSFLEASVPGLHELPAQVGPGLTIPSTPAALWCWLRGEEAGKLLHRGRELEALLEECFDLDDVVEGFLHDGGRDLTGYEDGTENPTEEAAEAAALRPDGSSLVVVQRWWHDLEAFEAHSQKEQDHLIGRRLSDNEELDDAPVSAHVKRTAQESFDPEAFILRRSMPWSEDGEAGLVFVAFGHSLDAFEAILGRMLGHEDGITDGLFRFTRPLDGRTFWCPPVVEGRLDLSLVLG